MRKLTKIFAGIFIAGLTIILLAAAFLYFYIDTTKISKFVTATVAAETGGLLEIEKIDFNAFTGLTVRNIKFTPPDIAGKPATESAPIVEIKKLKLHYKLWSLLYASLVIDAIMLEGGGVDLAQNNEVWNFGGIAKYRSTLPLKPEIPEEPKTPQTPIANLLEDVSKKFMIPLRISVNNVGLKDFDFQLVQKSSKSETKKIKVSHITVLLNMNAMGKTADLEVLTKLKALQLNDLRLNDLNTSLALSIAAQPEFKKIKLKELKLQILEQINVALNAGIWSEGRDTNKIGYDFALNADINSELTKKFSHLLPPGLNTKGIVELVVSPLQGHLDLDVIQRDLLNKNFGALLPDSIKTAVNVSNFSLNDAGNGLAVLPTNIAVEVLSTQKDNRINVTAKLKQIIDGITFAPPSDLSGTHLSIGKTDINLNASASYPADREFLSKFELNTEHITFKNRQVDAITFPFATTFNTTGLEDLSKVQAEIAVAVGELLQTKINVDCANVCEKFKVQVGAEIPSLNKIWDMARNTIARNVIPKFQPEQVEGSYLFTTQIDGSIPNPLKTDPQKILKALHFNSMIKSDLKDLTVKIPFNNTSIEKNNLTLQVTGSESQQKIDLAHNILNVTTTLPSRKKSGPIASINGFGWNTIVDINLPPLHLLQKYKKIPDVKLETKLATKEVSISQIFKQPFKDINLTAALSARDSKVVSLDLVELKVPDFNTSVKVNAFSKIGEDFKPLSFSTVVGIAMDKFPTEFMTGVQASGAFKGRFELSSEDMDMALFNGQIDLDNINAQIQDADSSKPPKFVLDSLTGTIPMRHAFAIQPLIAMTESPVTTKEDSEVDSSNTFTKTVGISDETIKETTKNYLDKIKPPTVGDTSLALSEDYLNFKDFFPGRRSITIKKIAAAGFELDNTEIDMELSQNKLAVNNFMTRFLGGKIQGESQVFFDNKPVSVKSSVHLTRLNTEHLIKNFKGLKKKAKGLISGGNPYLDGAVHLQYNLRTQDMAGGIDITSIGKDQLRMIMYYIDPTDSDTSISAIKTALNFGEVKFVSVPIKNGEIGVEVDIRVLTGAIPIPTPKLQGFPIAKLLSNFQNQDAVENESSH